MPSVDFAVPELPQLGWERARLAEQVIHRAGDTTAVSYICRVTPALGENSDSFVVTKSEISGLLLTYSRDGQLVMLAPYLARRAWQYAAETKL